MRKRGVGSAEVWDAEQGRASGWRVAAVLAALLCALLVVTVAQSCGASGHVSDRVLEEAVRKELHTYFLSEVRQATGKGEKMTLLRSGTSTEREPVTVEFEQRGRERVSLRCYGTGTFRPVLKLVDGSTFRGAEETCRGTMVADVESDDRVSGVTVTTSGEGMWLSWALTRPASADRGVAAGGDG